ALRGVVELGEERSGLDEVALVGGDGDDFAGNLKANLGQDLRFDRTDAEHADFNIGQRRDRANGDLAAVAPSVTGACQRHNDGQGSGGLGQPGPGIQGSWHSRPWIQPLRRAVLIQNKPDHSTLICSSLVSRWYL